MILRAIFLFSILCCGVVNAASPELAPQTMTPMPGLPPAPDFSLPDMDGKPHRLADYRGRVVVVNFWATWCPPCREEMPALQRAHEVLQADDIVVLAVNVGEDVDTIFTFTADYPMDFTLLLDRDSAVIGEWPIKGLPTTFVIDPAGRLAYRAIGGRSWDDRDLLDLIRQLKTTPAP